MAHTRPRHRVQEHRHSIGLFLLCVYISEFHRIRRCGAHECIQQVCAVHTQLKTVCLCMSSNAYSRSAVYAPQAVVMGSCHHGFVCQLCFMIGFQRAYAYACSRVHTAYVKFVGVTRVPRMCRGTLHNHVIRCSYTCFLTQTNIHAHMRAQA
jgi:hypothetical protein